MSKANLGKKNNPEKGCVIFSYLWCNVYEPMIAIHVVKNSEGNYRSITKLRTKIELNKKNKTITQNFHTKSRDNYFFVVWNLCNDRGDKFISKFSAMSNDIATFI